jgi:hypothetical protein
MEILQILAGFLVGGGVGVFATRYFWPRILVDQDFLRKVQEKERDLVATATKETKRLAAESRQLKDQERLLDEREVDLVERESVIAERLRLAEDKRFHVVFHTDGGGAARKLWEKVEPTGDGVMEFLDGTARRGHKEAK